MNIVSWFILSLIILIIGLNVWIAIKIGYHDYKIKKIEKKSKKTLDIKK